MGLLITFNSLCDVKLRVSVQCWLLARGYPQSLVSSQGLSTGPLIRWQLASVEQENRREREHVSKIEVILSKLISEVPSHHFCYILFKFSLYAQEELLRMWIPGIVGSHLEAAYHTNLLCLMFVSHHWNVKFHEGRELCSLHQYMS